MEGLRTDSLYTPLLHLRVSQILAGMTVAVGIILLVVCRKRTCKAADTKKQPLYYEGYEQESEENGTEGHDSQDTGIVQ